jgi:hypothetical protein
MDILLILTISILNIVCFFIGAKIGQKTVKGENIEAPNLSKLNPMNIYREHEEKKEAQREKEKLEVILGNIERYDGTGARQEDVPM